MLHEVLFLRLMGGDAHAAAVLRLVSGYGKALYIARMGERNYHVFHGNEVCVLDFAVVYGNLRLSLGGIPLFDIQKVGLDYVEHSALVGENVFKVGNLRLQLAQFIGELIYFEVRQPVQPEFGDGVCLALVEHEVCHQLYHAVVFVLRRLAYFDYFVYARLGDDKAAQNVRPLLGFI